MMVREELGGGGGGGGGGSKFNCVFLHRWTHPNLYFSTLFITLQQKVHSRRWRSPWVKTKYTAGPHRFTNTGSEEMYSRKNKIVCGWGFYKQQSWTLRMRCCSDRESLNSEQDVLYTLANRKSVQWPYCAGGLRNTKLWHFCVLFIFWTLCLLVWYVYFYVRCLKGEGLKWKACTKRMY